MLTLLLLVAATQQIPNFKEQVVDTELPDQVVWYENPGTAGKPWKRRIILEKEPNLPVCIQALDVDGDGKVELILGADWPINPKTKISGTVWLLKRPDDLDHPWTPIKIEEEATMHRMRVIDI